MLGHVVNNRDAVLSTLGEEPSVGDAGARYRRGTEPVAGDEEGLLTLEQLLAYLEQAQERIAAALSHISDEALAREVMLGERKVTVGQRLFFFYFHETFHVGQTEIFRQLAGKDDKII